VQRDLESILDRWFPLPIEKMGVAVSGGVDSLALAYGLNQWAVKKGGCSIIPIIIHHGLRDNEGQECQYVADLLTTWGLNPVILPWVHEPITTGLLERARYGKYATLAMGCHQRGIRHLCLGHHQDDMLETVWMRQKNHAPEHALSGMSAVTMRYGVMILRPFLHTPKHALESWMRDCGVCWVNDPVNTDPAYDRTAARQSIEMWTSDTRKYALERLYAQGAKRRAHEEELSGLTSSIHGLGHICVHDFMALIHLPVWDGRLWIQSWVHSFSFAPIAGVLGQNRLWRVLCETFSEKSHQPGKIIATFAGCIFVRCQGQLWIFREHARIHAHPVLGNETMWDDRIFSDKPIPLQRAEESKKGTWQDRFVRACLPKDWDPATMTYVACNMPYPHFRTVDHGVLPLVQDVTTDRPLSQDNTGMHARFF
jgi:tRNA(Ile)-lysidine synthase